MKTFIIYTAFSLALIIPCSLNAQQGKKPGSQNPQQAINEEMEKAMKNMTPQQREQMKKMMPAIMPAILENANDYRYPEFTSNKELIPKKDAARINAIPKYKLTQAGISTYANSLFSKLMAKGDAAEITIIKSVMAKGSSADHFGNAAVLCMLQGHAQAALGLSMKAVQAEPTNANWQNNMASLLTQYGYAEQAIPVLQKLKNELPENSTVFNNLAQAWFTLGVLDSAKTYTLIAGKLNPDNPDAKVCGGVIDEAEGNTAGAIEKYKEAMAQSPDGFTETMLKNSKGQYGINDIDFDKLIENITIYSYFPKDWIQIPELSNKVSGYENDVAIKNGYAKMFTSFFKDLQFKINQSEAEITNLMKQGNEGFANDMFAAGKNHGTSFISTPARIIISLITLKLQKLSWEYAEVKKEMRDYMERKTQEKINAGKNDNCEVSDSRNNKFLAEVNHSNRPSFELWIEHYRTWLNAYCTWTWYLTGNIKNVSMAQCLNFTKFFAELYRDAIAMQQTGAPCGVEGLNGRGETKPTTPLIPDFKCPTVVSVPAGQDWHALDSKLKNFDANSLGIKKLAGAPVPNMSIAYGAGGKHIAQPGQATVTKIASGNLLPLYGGTPLPEYPNKISQKEVNAAYDRGLGKMMKQTNQKKMQAMTSSPCDKLQTMKEEDRKKYWEEKKRKAEEQLRADKEIERMKKELEKILENKAFEELLREVPVKTLDDFIKSAVQNPSLSSSVQAPNTFTPQQNLCK